MEVIRVKRKIRWNECRLEATIRFSKETFKLWYRIPSCYRRFVDPINGDPFLAALLLPAMYLQEPLHIPLACSPMLVRNLEKIQRIYSSWDRRLAFIDVNVILNDKYTKYAFEKDKANALFFSLGVDSFYSLFRNIDSIHFLLVVHGFDVFYGKNNHALFPVVFKKATKVGREFKKKVIKVTTNIRDLSDRFVSWPKLYHGAAMASVALLFEGFFEKVYIAATYTWKQLHPHGSHPYLDPLWSTENLSILHHGCEATRLDKIKFISQYPIVLDTLRVCWVNTGGSYNCGRCEKCLRTMIGLYICGVLERCKTFPNKINIEDLKNICVETSGDFFTELIEALGSSQFDLQIKNVLCELQTHRRNKQ